MLALVWLLGSSSPAWAVSPHATYTGSDTCSTCHSVHQATTQLGLFRSTGASSGEVPVCYSCHDGTGASTNIKTGPDSFGLSSGHVLESVVGSATADLTNTCSSCHTAHGDYTTRPDLPARTINGVAVSGTGNAWCLACHNATNDWYAKKGTYPALSSPTRDAAGFPVAGTFAGPAVYNDSTKNPHLLIPASSGATTRTAGDCLYCHAAHGSAARYDGLVGTLAPSTAATVANDRSTGAYAALCLTCHGGGSWEASGAADIKQYVTYGASDTGIGAAGGHRIKSSGGTLPVNAPLPCYDCHDPHGSSRGNAKLLSDALGASLDTSASPASVRKACLSCHTTSDGLGWDSGAGAYVTPAATATVEGLNRGGGAAGSGPDGGQNWLHIRTTPGHLSTDTSMSCYECHGSDYGSASSSNVHDPATYSATAHVSAGGSDFVSAGMENGDHGLGDGEYANCSDCHITALATLHVSDCDACHSSTAPDAVKAAVANRITDCTACHPSQHTTDNPSHEDIYNNGCDCHPNSPGNDDPTTSCTACHPATTPVPIPSTLSDARSSYINDATIHLTPSDNVSGSFGIRATYYILDGSPAVTGTVIPVPAPASGSQNHALTFWSTDWTGLTELSHTATFTVTHDSFSPVTTSTIMPGKTYAGDQTFTLTVTDPYSYVTGTWWQLDSTTGTWNSGTSVAVAAPHSGTVAHTLYYYSRDAVGNTELVKSVSFSVLAGRDFAFTGANQSFVVPSNVTTVSVTMYGGSGGGNWYGSTWDKGGMGGKVTAVIPVTPGSTLTVRVGGMGMDYLYGGDGLVHTIGAWPNGGNGGRGNTVQGGGAGGGSSSILSGSSVLIEAGGAGGAGYGVGGNGGSQGTGVGGNQSGGNGNIIGGGGGGGWNGGKAGDWSGYPGGGGLGGTSYIAIGSGTLTAGSNTGNGSVTIRYSAP
jgi:predicted CXXCH cytochrome family protein